MPGLVLAILFALGWMPLFVYRAEIDAAMRCRTTRPPNAAGSC